MSGLKELTLGHNAITLIVADCLPSSLEKLDLSHNLLEEIQGGVLQNLEDLVDLNLSGNRLTGMAATFSLPSLVSLDLSQNLIAILDRNGFSKFPELKELKLGYNNLTSISSDIFSKKGSLLTNLELHGNKLVSLGHEVGERLESSGKITLGGNPWACSCLWDIMKHLSDREIGQPGCDSEFLSSGDAAVCVVMNVECDGSEILTDEQYEEFRRSLKYYTCGRD